MVQASGWFLTTPDARYLTPDGSEGNSYCQLGLLARLSGGELSERVGERIVLESAPDAPEVIASEQIEDLGNELRPPARAPHQ